MTRCTKVVAYTTVVSCAKAVAYAKFVSCAKVVANVSEIAAYYNHKQMADIK